MKIRLRLRRRDARRLKRICRRHGLTVKQFVRWAVMDQVRVDEAVWTPATRLTGTMVRQAIKKLEH